MPPRGCRRSTPCTSVAALRSVLAIVAILLGHSVFAEPQTLLTGVVHDQQGRIVPNVTIVAVHEASGRRWSAVSSPDGVYEFGALPAGMYRVLVELEAFVPFETSGVEVTGRLRAALDINLVLAAKDTVTVQGQTTSSDTLFGPSERTSFFRGQDLASLPLPSGRNLQSIQPLVPGILFTESTGSLAQFSAMGQRRFGNRLLIDGPWA